MKDTEKHYFESVGSLSDFGARTTAFAVQTSALGDVVYSSRLNGAATVLSDQFNSVTAAASIFPYLDTSIHSQVTVLAREANQAISFLGTSACVGSLASAVVSSPSTWLNGIVSSPMVFQNEAFTQLAGKSAITFATRVGTTLANEIRISNPLIDPYKASLLGVESNLARISATSILAEGALSSFKWAELGSHIGIHDSVRTALSDSFIGLSKSYSDVFTAVQHAPLSMLENSAVIVRQTPTEYYTSAEFCRAISAPDTQAIEKELIDNDIMIDNAYGLESRLPLLDPALADMWHGASQALASDNPDRVRHFSASIRELLTHVVHKLSPDNDVMQWSSDPEHYHDNRPTREARLLYISRNINLGGFQKFVRKDVAATVEFLNLFQEGTHSIKSSLTERQLLALKAKAESTLNFLIDIGFQGS